MKASAHWTPELEHRRAARICGCSPVPKADFAAPLPYYCRTSRPCRLNILINHYFGGAPYGNRTRVTAVKGRCPGPLDEGRGRGQAARRRYKEVDGQEQPAFGGRARVIGPYGEEPRASTACRTMAVLLGRPSTRRLRRRLSMRTLLTNFLCSASRTKVPSAPAACPSAKSRWNACRASARTPCCRRAAGG